MINQTQNNINDSQSNLLGESCQKVEENQDEGQSANKVLNQDTIESRSRTPMNDIMRIQTVGGTMDVSNNRLQHHESETIFGGQDLFQQPLMAKQPTVQQKNQGIYESYHNQPPSDTTKIFASQLSQDNESAYINQAHKQKVKKKNQIGYELSQGSPIKKVISRKVEDDALNLELEGFNKLKRPELSNMSLHDLKNVTGESLINMVQQARVTAELGKIVDKQKKIEDGNGSDENEIDDPFEMEEFEPETQNQDHNKNVFRRNYGIETQLPGQYVVDAKVWPKNLNYVFRVMKYTVTENEQFQIQCLMPKQQWEKDEKNRDIMVFDETEIKSQKAFYTNNNQGELRHDQDFGHVLYQNKVCVMQLLMLKDNQFFVKQKEIPYIGDNKVEVEFSIKGEFMLIFAKHQKKIQVYRVGDDIEAVFDSIAKGVKPYREYIGLEDLLQCTNSFFGRQENFLAIYGTHLVIIFDLRENGKNEMMRRYEINSEEYEEILDLKLASLESSNEFGEQFKCEVACKKKNENILQIIDLSRHIKPTSILDPPTYKINKNKKIFFLAPRGSNIVTSSMIQVKIREDFKKVVMTCGKDTYELTQNDTNSEYSQRMISIGSGNEETVKNAFSFKDNFYYIMHKDFDDGFKVMSNKIDPQTKKNFQTKINVSISPDINQRVLDFKMKSNKDPGEPDLIALLSVTDQNLSYNIIEITSAGLKVINSVKDDVIGSYSTMWPYVAYTDGENKLNLINSFDQYILRKFTLPGLSSVSKIEKVFITPMFDLFYLVNHTTAKKYEMFQIDLDYPVDFNMFNEQKFLLRRVMEYSYERVGNRPLLDMIVRSSSEKEKSSTNKQLFVFVLHKEFLYFWVKGEIKDVGPCHSTKLIQLNGQSFIYEKIPQIADDTQTVENFLKMNVIVQIVEMRFSMYAEHELFTEKCPIGNLIEAWVYDNKRNYVLILYKSDNLKQNQRKLVVHDVENKKRIGVAIMEDPEIISRIESGLFTLENAHMYFGNQVFKLRYDIMLNTKSDFISENHFFDKYDDIIDMSPGERIFSQMPIFSLTGNKQVYFLGNQQSKRPFKMIVVPYLHERKLYLNEMKPSHKYFFTIVEHPRNKIASVKNAMKQQRPKNYMVSLDMTGYKGNVYSEGGLLYQRFNWIHLASEWGQAIAVSPSGRYFVFQDNKSPRRVAILELSTDFVKNVFTFSMQFRKKIDVQACMYSYANDYKEACKGTPQADFAHELNHKLTYDYQKFKIEKNNIYNYKINDQMDLVVEIRNLVDMQLEERFNQLVPLEEERPVVTEILNLTAKGYDHEASKRQHKVVIRKDISTIIKQKMRILSNDTQQKFQTKYLTIGIQLNLAKSLSNMQGTIIYIQQGDVEFNAKKHWYCFDYLDKENDISEDGVAHHLINEISRKFVEVNQRNKENQQLSKKSLLSQKLIFSKDFEIFRESYHPGNYTFNNNSLFFWNHFTTWKMNFKDKLQHQINVFEFDLNVDKDEMESYIKMITCGPQPDAFDSYSPEDTQGQPEYVTVKVRMSKTQDMTILWDVINDCELISFDTHPTASIIYDKSGDSYIMDRDSVVVCKQGVRLKSYDLTCLGNTHKLQFGLQYGHHFDLYNHNFMLMNEYIGLAFSFMSLVIRDTHQKITQDQLDDYQPDLEQYNFNMNMRTFLTCDNFVIYNIVSLEQALEFIKKWDPLLLEQLLYYYLEEVIDGANESIFMRMSLTGFSSGFTPPERIKKTYIKHTALRIARQNTRSASLLLEYMSLCYSNSSGTFSDIIGDFVENSSFHQYIKELPFQSKEMMNKTTIAISEAYNDQIVCVEHAPVSYVDEAFYRQYLHENKQDPSFTNFVIKMSAVRVDWIIQTDDGKKFLEALLYSDNDSIFETKSVIVIVEYLYSNYKKAILKKHLPIYLVKLLVYFLSMKCNISDPWDDTGFNHFVNALNYINLVLAASTLVTMVQIIIHNGVVAFKSVWIYIDMMYFILLLLIASISVDLSLQDFQLRYHEDIELGVRLKSPDASSNVVKAPEIDNKNIQVYNVNLLQAFLSIAIFGRLLYFMQIIDQIAPLVSIIFIICKEIKWFIILYLIIVFALSSSFELLGRNQVAFGVNAENDSFDAQYLTSFGAYLHVFLIGIGDFQMDTYNLDTEDKDGNPLMLKYAMYFFWVVSVFTLTIHLLNMLIAIMGETFAKNNDTKDIQTTRSHLQFVLDNWYIDPIQNKNRIKYLVMAFVKQDDDQESEQLLKLIKQQQEVERLVEDKFQDLNDNVQQNFNSLSIQLQDIRQNQMRLEKAILSLKH